MDYKQHRLFGNILQIVTTKPLHNTPITIDTHFTQIHLVLGTVKQVNEYAGGFKRNEIREQKMASEQNIILV